MLDTLGLENVLFGFHSQREATYHQSVTVRRPAAQWRCCKWRVRTEWQCLGDLRRSCEFGNISASPCPELAEGKKEKWRRKKHDNNCKTTWKRFFPIELHRCMRNKRQPGRCFYPMTKFTSPEVNTIGKAFIRSAKKNKTNENMNKSCTCYCTWSAHEGLQRSSRLPEDAAKILEESTRKYSGLKLGIFLVFTKQLKNKELECLVILCWTWRWFVCSPCLTDSGTGTCCSARRHVCRSMLLKLSPPGRHVINFQWQKWVIHLPSL